MHERSRAALQGSEPCEMSDPMSPVMRTASTPVIAVDTGGTFTDLVLWRDGALTTLKVPSTPPDPAQAVLDGIRRLVAEGEPLPPPARLDRRNQRAARAARRARGARDERGLRGRDRDRATEPPAALRAGGTPPAAPGGPRGPHRRAGPAGSPGRGDRAARPLRAGGAGRRSSGARGRVRRGVPPARLCEPGARAGAWPTRSTPPACPLSVSSELLPEFREYERTSTTVVNAYVAPVMSRYLGRLSDEAGAERVTIMGSNGGALPVARARREPVHTVLSGPGGRRGRRARLGAPRRATSACSPSTWAARPPTCRSVPDTPCGRGSSTSTGSRSRSRSSTSTRSAPEAARWRGSTRGARCASGRRAREPTPGRSATAAAAPA